jgi:hypothetical protein
MKRIGFGIAALGLSLSALTLGSKAANAAEPCAPVVIHAAAAPCDRPVVVRGTAYGWNGRTAREQPARFQQQPARFRVQPKRILYQQKHYRRF